MEPLIVLSLFAGAFAIVNGANDGATLVANGLKVSSFRPITAILILIVSVATVPILFGTEVATTLVGRLVTFEGDEGLRAVAVAILAATLVSLLLTRLGLPTSLTLSLIGGLAGAGVGARLPVAWGTVGYVLCLAAAAPFAGGAIAYLLATVPLRLPERLKIERVVANGHRLGFGLQCLAYGANDGQKMLAVFAVAFGHQTGEVVADPKLLAVIALLFLVGLIGGLRHVADTISNGVVATRPYDATVAGISSAAAVLSTAAIGVPVSTTQAITGSLVGVGARRGIGSVRWQVAARLAGAWVITLPSAAVFALAGMAVLRLAR